MPTIEKVSINIQYQCPVDCTGTNKHCVYSKSTIMLLIILPHFPKFILLSPSWDFKKSDGEREGKHKWFGKNSMVNVA